MHEKVLWILKRACNEGNWFCKEKKWSYKQKQQLTLWKRKICYIFRENFEDKYAKDNKFHKARELELLQIPYVI